jgi:ribokinase
MKMCGDATGPVDGPAPPRIVVVGSLNVDYTLRVATIVKPGETRMALESFSSFGGKGANQAVAARKAGAEVELVGCVGNDGPGRSYLDYLRGQGLGVEGIVTREVPTGSAFIQVDVSGENAIVVNPGANETLTARDVELAEPFIAKAGVLLVQLEVPFEAVCTAAGMARRLGVFVILNASPVTEAYLRGQLSVDVLVVNEQEALAILGGPVDSWTGRERELLDRLRCEQLVVTRGSLATLWFDANGSRSVEPPRITPVDTVGAGDAFAGAFAVASAMSGDVDEILGFSNAAGALSTLRHGAQTALPERDEILKFAKSS